jgi:hypothetical protein
LEVDVQQGNFKILQLLLQIHIFFWVEKWNPPTRSETAKIGPKTEGILGVNGLLLQIQSTTVGIRKILVSVCDTIYQRGAGLAAAGIVGTLKKIGRNGSIANGSIR